MTPHDHVPVLNAVCVFFFLRCLHSDVDEIRLRSVDSEGVMTADSFCVAAEAAGLLVFKSRPGLRSDDPPMVAPIPPSVAASVTGPISNVLGSTAASSASGAGTGGGGGGSSAVSVAQATVGGGGVGASGGALSGGAAAASSGRPQRTTMFVQMLLMEARPCGVRMNCLRTVWTTVKPALTQWLSEEEGMS